MSDPTYSGYLSWISIASMLVSFIVGLIIILFLGLIQKITPYGLENISGTSVGISYLVIYIIIWIVIFRYSSYENYVKNE